MNISERLGQLATFYHDEARKCSQGRAYLAASVMQVSALEAALQAMCFIYPERVKKTKVYQRKKFKKKRNKALDFKLYELINIAEELSWFSPKSVTWGGKRTTLAGFTHEARDLRNYVHPGKWAPEHSDTTKFTKHVYEVVYEIFDVATSSLFNLIVENIKRREKH